MAGAGRVLTVDEVRQRQGQNRVLTVDEVRVRLAGTTASPSQPVAATAPPRVEPKRKEMSAYLPGSGTPIAAPRVAPKTKATSSYVPGSGVAVKRLDSYLKRQAVAPAPLLAADRKSREAVHQVYRQDVDSDPEIAAERVRSAQADLVRLRTEKDGLHVGSKPLYTAAWGSGPMVPDGAEKMEFGKKITQKERELIQLQAKEQAAYFQSLPAQPDFKSLSAKGAAIENPSMDDAENGFAFGDWRPMAAKVGNVVTYSRDNAMDIAQRAPQNKSLQGKQLYQYMTDGEVDTYNYLLARDGEEKAGEYLTYIEETLNWRAGTELGKGIRGIENGIGRTAMTALHGFTAGLDQFGSGARQLVSNDRLPTSALQFGSGYIRNDLKETGPKLLGSSLGQVAYDMTTTTGNMTPSILLATVTGGLGAPAAVASGVGAATMGASAGGNAYNQALEEGYTKTQAKNYALLVGASEGSLQYLLGGIGALGGKVTGTVAQNTIRNIDSALLRTAAELGVNMAGEGTEEYLQEILSPVLRNLALDENNEFRPVSQEAAYSFLMGALSSALMEGGSVVSANRGLGQHDTQTQRGEGPVATPNGLPARSSTQAAALVEGAVVPQLWEAAREDASAMLGVTKIPHQSAVAAASPEGAPQGMKAPPQGTTAPLGERGTGIAEGSEAATHTPKYAAAFGENGKKAFTEGLEQLKKYHDDTDFTQYYGGFAQFYTAGVRGTDMKRVANQFALPLPQQIVAHNSGKRDAALSLKRDMMATQYATVAGADSGLVADDYVKANMDSETFDQLNFLSKALGIRTQFVDSIRGGTANASINGYEVRIEKNNPHPVRALLGHEVAHRLQELAPVEYRAFRDFVAEELDKSAWIMREDYAADGVDIDYESALDEAVADRAGRLMEDGKLLDDFIARNGKNPTLLEKLRDVFRAIVAKVTGKDRDPIAAAEKKLTAALVAAEKQAATLTGQKNTAQVGGVERFSINPGFSSQLDAWDGKADKTFHLGTTSDALQSLGILDRGIIWHSRKIGKILNEHDGMTLDIIRQVPRLLEHPVAILKSQQSDSRIVMFGELVDQNGNPVTAILELQPTKKGGQLLNLNVVASAYGKNNPRNFIQTSKLLYLDPNENRTKRWLQGLGLQLPSDVTALGSIGTISYQGDVVKIDGVPYGQYMLNGQKNTAQVDGGERFSLKGYTPHERKNWENSKRIVIYEGESQLRQFIQDALDGKNLEKKMYFGAIPSNLAEKIVADTGVDVEGYNCTLRASEVKKILKDHGQEKAETLRGQRAIITDDFSLIPTVIQSPDSITLDNRLFEGKPIIRFTKNIDGRITVSAYVSGKHLDLTVQTMYAGKKKGNLAIAADEQASANTSETHDGIVSYADTVPQEDGESKTKFSMKSDPYSGKSLTEDGEIYTYDFLANLPDMAVTALPAIGRVVDGGGRVDAKTVVDLGMKNAKHLGHQRDGKVFVRNSYTGVSLRVDNSSIRHGLNGGLNRLLTNARLGAVIGDVVQSAVPINALQNKADNVEGTYAMAAYTTDSDGREYIAIVTVEQRAGNISGIDVYDVAHAVSGRHKKGNKRVDTKSQGVYPSTNVSTITIADLLEVVKSTHQSILPSGVLTHMGEVRNPGGFYTGQVKFSRKVDAEGYATRGTHWAIRAGVLDKKDQAVFWETLANINKLGYACPKTYEGEYIIDTGDKLLFTDGDFKAPTLSRVIVFASQYESNLDELKGRIYHEEAEKGYRTGDRESIRAIENLEGNEYVVEYFMRDYRAHAGQDGTREGNDGSGNPGTPQKREWRFSLKDSGSTDKGMASLVEESIPADDQVSLTLEEESAILQYKSSESYKINAKLRNGMVLSPREQQFVAQMDAALLKLPTYSGTVYRNIAFDGFGDRAALEKFLAQHSVGDIVGYTAFTSASINEDGYPVHGIHTAHIIIDGRSGRIMDGFGNNFESEVVFQRETEFVITHTAYRQDGTPIIFIKECVDDATGDYGQLYSQERREGMQQMQASHSGDGNLQGLSNQDSPRNSIRSQPHDPIPRGQRDSVPGEGVAGNTDMRHSLKTALGDEIAALVKVAKAEGYNQGEIEAQVRQLVGDTYDAMVEQYGTMPPGEKSVRTARVPRKTGDTAKVSRTVRTILEAGATPEIAIPDIEELTARGDLSYETYTDKQSMSDAQETIQYDGWDGALADWFKQVNQGIVSKANAAMGWTLYNNAANSGNIATAMEILNAMVVHQRNGAQAVQATRILKKLSPEAQLYGAKRSVHSLQKELNERYGNKKSPKLEIKEELAAELLRAETQKEQEDALKNIYRDIGRQMPSTLKDKWNALRYLAMLCNPRTHVRNIVGNAGFAPVVLAKNLTATAIESMVGRVSGGKLGRSKGMVGASAADRALVSAAYADYETVAEVALGGGKYNDMASSNKYVEEGRSIYKNKLLETARKGNSKLLDMEDGWFARPHYAYALAQFCKANGITTEQIMGGGGVIMDKARAYAIKEAQKATYRDANFFSQAVSDLGRYTGKNPIQKGISVLADGTLPFRKTPANILVRGVEYSPIGLLKGLSYDLFQVQKGNMAGAEAIDHISAGLTGTGVMALGMFLAAQMLVRGMGGDDEDKRKFEELQGHQSYSLELPDGTSVTLDWMAPAALPFFVGVNLWEQMSGGTEGLTLAEAMTAAQNVAEPLLEMSCLQSLNDLLDSVGSAYSDGLGALPSALAGMVTSYLTQAIPTVLGQAERTSEGERMTTYTEKNGFLTTDMQYALGRASARIPGFEFGQIPYIDAWGRTESTGGVGKRAANNFLNPAYTSTVESSAMEDELLRLYETTGEPGVLPSRAEKYFTVDGVRKDLTGEEYVKYATTKGERAYQLMTALTTSREYLALDDGGKVRAVEDVYDLANKAAKSAISDYVADAWAQKAIEAEKRYAIPQDTYILLKTRTAGVESLKDKSGETIANSKSLLIMEAVYNTPGLSEKQRKAMFEYLGVGKSVLHFNKALVTSKLASMRKGKK